MIILATGTAWNDQYTSNEVEEIRIYVEKGGGLLIMAENADCFNENINPVAEVFGVTCGLSSLYPLDLFIDSLENHVIFNTINQIYYRAGGQIDVIDGPLHPIASFDTMIVASAGQYKYGRVVVMGDMSCLHNDCLNYGENTQFAINMFNWLIGSSTSIDDNRFNTPDEILISQNYPNPFNVSTMIKYNLDRQTRVKIDIYDILGNLIETPFNTEQTVGVHRIFWNAGRLSSGLYFYRIQAGDICETGKMTLIK